jgi:tetratricopeptide (TPR) repeat protein
MKKDLLKTYLETANILMEKKDYYNAKLAYDRALALAPEDNAICALQEIVQSKKHIKSFEDVSTSVSNTCEEDLEIDLINALLVAMNKNSALAEMQQSINRLIEIYKSNKIDDGMKVEVLSAVAEGLALAVKSDDAIDIADEKYLELADPFLHVAHLTEADQAKSLLARGRILHALAQHPANTYFLGEAIQILEKAAELEPTNPLLWCELGQCYQEARNSLKAVESYDKALALNPNNMTALANGAAENFKIGQSNRSLAILWQAANQTDDMRDLNAISKQINEIVIEREVLAE